jgi:3-methyladenine DNA glycosylase/8-oxoguanine DNA glycosylase
MILNIHAKPPFSLSSVINSHGWMRLEPFQTSQGDSILFYTYLTRNSQVVRLVIKQSTDGVAVELVGDIERSQIEEITSAVTWMLALDEDFTEFYALASQETKLQQVEKNAQGRLLRSPTLFEDMIKTILTTNTSWSGTIRMTAALVEQFGDPMPGSNNKYAFPTPERIARSDEQTLRQVTRLGYRAPYILQLAQEVSSGSLDLESYKSGEMEADQVHSQLLSVKGIGNYAAANLMMLLGYYDYLTIDSWAIKMVSREFFNGDPISPQDVKDVFERWGKWKGLVYWLWNWSDSE